MDDTMTLQAAVSQARERWNRGESPSATGILASFPNLGGCKSAVLELAYEEYCRRTDTGERLDAVSFCARFPICAASLQRRLEVHRFVEEHFDELATSEEWPLPGDAFGDFELVEELGRGIASRVFVARQRKLDNRLVVLKLSHHGYREARVMSRLEHPNIVPIHSVEEDDEFGFVAICMPFVTRWTLLDFIDAAFHHGAPPRMFVEVIERLHNADSSTRPTAEEAPLPRSLRRASYFDGVIYLVLQICEALRHTHERGILHLDLKPTNVLLTASARPLLLDFNLSVEASMQTAFGGTLPYMSPEQLRVYGGGDAKVDRRSDVFALGVMLYQLLSGRVPYEVTEPRQESETAHRDLSELHQIIPQPLRRTAVGVDSTIRSLVAECLDFEPSKRPRNVKELAARLRRSMGFDRWATRWLSSHRRLVSIVMLFCMIGTGGLSYAILTRPPYHAVEFDRGRNLVTRGKAKPAIEAFTRAIQAQPDRDVYYYARGRAYQLDGNLPSAFDDYRHAFQLAPRPEYFARAGHCRALEGDWQVAIELFSRARQANGDSASLLVCLGHSYFREHSFEKGERAFSEAIRIEPDCWLGYYGRALCRMQAAMTMRTRMDRDTIYDIERAVELGPAHPQLLTDAALVWYEFAASTEQPIESMKIVGYLRAAATHGMNRSELLTWKRRLALNDSQMSELAIPASGATTPVHPVDFLPDPIMDEPFGSDLFAQSTMQQ